MGPVARQRSDVAALPPPGSLSPMLATSGPLPPELPGRWAYEMKWDGVRALLHLDGSGGLHVVSRSLRDVTASYPELGGLPEAVAAPCVLDGEVVAVDGAGRPSFSVLQRRMHVRAPGSALVREVPVTFLAFDVLHVGGTSLLRRTYDERREELDHLLPPGPRWAVPPVFDGAGEAALATSAAQGLEGVVAKLRHSTYEPGRRSRAWVKVKNLRTQEVVLGGWRPGAGSREGGIGSLLLGVPDADGLRYVGHVGTGFDRAALADLIGRLAPLERADPPFSAPLPRPHARDARWTEPRIVGEVAYAERTPDGLLRHPVWRGLRLDKAPSDVVDEP
jgi:bifunctional non-homologous end joining protein LigD